MTLSSSGLVVMSDPVNARITPGARSWPEERKWSIVADASPDESEMQVETLELINAELVGRLARQAESMSKIDTKATALTGIAIAAASFLSTREADSVLAGLAYVSYAAAGGLSFAANAVASYQDAPTPRPLFNKYAAATRTATLAALSATRVKAFEANVPRHARKGRLWAASAGALALGVVLMISAILVHN